MNQIPGILGGCFHQFGWGDYRLITLTVLLFSCKQNHRPAPAPTPEGKLIYKQYCVSCHGADGTMGANGASNLAVSALSEEETIAIISHGRKVMTPFKEILTEDEIKAVAKYVMTMRKGSSLNK
ncbi:MAG TPA: cytochrome c [Chitinophagales bacterium]|nr:cytochrome c [Chitinophagales bacterium]